MLHRLTYTDLYGEIILLQNLAFQAILSIIFFGLHFFGLGLDAPSLDKDLCMALSY